MPELTLLLDITNGALTLEGLSANDAKHLLGTVLPAAEAVNCGRPQPAQIVVAPRLPAPPPAVPQLRLWRLYHGSVVDGPGRRTVIQTAGCSIRCASCYLPQTHDFAAGRWWTVTDLVRLALDPAGAPRDGVTILGGEPFDQPLGLAHLARALKAAGAHLTLYTGYTLEALQARGDPSTNEALGHADLLIDGPFIASLTGGAGEYRGSRNQRLLTRDEIAFR